MNRAETLKNEALHIVKYNTEYDARLDQKKRDYVYLQSKLSKIN